MKKNPVDSDIIPQPQHTRPRTGFFSLASCRGICIPNDSSSADFVRMARQLQKEVAAETKIRLAVQERQNAASARHRIVICRPEQLPATWRKLKPMEKQCAMTEQGYVLDISPEKILLVADRAAGVFYGMQSLLQLAARHGARIPAMEIADHPAIQNRMVLIDISQGGFAIIDVAYWKRIIRNLARFKINQLMLYLEDAYNYEKYPFLGRKGGLTKAKAVLLGEYARRHQIELIPLQSSFAHIPEILHNDELAGLREKRIHTESVARRVHLKNWILCTANPKTFVFLRELLSELAGAFSNSQHLHVGCDEIWGFCSCARCQKMAAKLNGVERLYFYHMERLARIVKDTGREMMYWELINPPRGIRKRKADRLLSKLDATIFSYRYDNPKSYPIIKHYQNLGFRKIYVCPAITRYYYSCHNRFDKTFGNIRGFLRAGAKAGVTGECTCTWLNGYRNLLENNWYGLIYSADCAWNPGHHDVADFQRRFAAIWFGFAGEDRGTIIQEVIHAPYARTRDGHTRPFWEKARGTMGPLLYPADIPAYERLITTERGLVKDAHRLNALTGEKLKITAEIKKRARRNRRTLEFAELDLRLHRYVANKIIAVEKISEDYKQAYKFQETNPVLTIRKLQDIAQALTRMNQEHNYFVRMFTRAIKESGGDYLAISLFERRLDENQRVIGKLNSYLARFRKGERVWLPNMVSMNAASAFSWFAVLG
ncbi:MAG: beta-N-acetylhexosaminidase [Verrucomicrobia bacterium]|nr:beta-N-acetylhexosaminidase [Verrucomicrobiota bacterium]